MFSYRMIQRKANEAGLTLRKGYQRYLDPAFGTYVTDKNGKKITGYEVMDWQTGYTVKGSHNGIYDHAMTLDEAIEAVKDFCEMRHVNF